MKNGQYTWNENDGEYWNHDSFDTFEEALEDAKVNIDEEYDDVDIRGDIKGVYIGQVRDFIPRVRSDCVIDQMTEDAYELVGEASDHYLSKVSKEHEEELTKTLTMAFNLWVEKYGYTPDFYHIDGIEFVEFE